MRRRKPAPLPGGTQDGAGAAAKDAGLEPLREGALAPEFQLPDQNGRVRSLHEERGRWVVLYFYPKDDTTACTREACEFRDQFVAFSEAGAQVLGVSLDRVKSHEHFAVKHGLPFPILSDRGGWVALAYGVRGGLGPLKYAKRATFLIDPQGRVARIYRKVKPKTHVDEVIADLRARRNQA
ncbi:MAG: hypothetical protein B7Z66_07540 [Chromatiales bacterium 21-64-14]|nr:MAG: hypothetical protein B7Z66_07540 [Chromatiales bacterium 21-64-14]